MSYSKKYYAMAEDIIENRKTANKAVLDRRISEIETKYPRYAKLNQTLTSTGHKLAKIILSRTENAAALVKNLERENIKIQHEMEQILVQNGYPKNYLDEIYTCSRCKDTGIYNYKRCSCFNDVLKSISAQELNDSSPIRLCSFETFDVSRYPDREDGKLQVNIRKFMQDNLKYCLDYANNFHLPVNGIVMYGQTGLGKTHLSLAIANNVIQLGYSVVYGSAPDLFRKIENEHFGRETEENTEDLLQSADLLILDDLGAEFDSQFYISVLYNLLNTRLNLQLPTIVNTNLTPSELKQRYSDRIASRLFSMKRMLFCGQDLRLK